MALDPLAAAADLTARHIVVPVTMDDDALLASASDAVREAAGHPISECESTVVLVADDYRWLELPAGPVTAVDTVEVDGVATTAWTLYGDALLADTTWTTCLPANIEVTYTHGYATVPADIVDLVCGLVAMAVAQDGNYGAAGQVASVKLGDFAESYTNPQGTESPSPMSLPDMLRAKLRARFGTSVGLIGFRK